MRACVCGVRVFSVYTFVIYVQCSMSTFSMLSCYISVNIFPSVLKYIESQRQHRIWLWLCVYLSPIACVCVLVCAGICWLAINVSTHHYCCACFNKLYFTILFLCEMSTWVLLSVIIGQSVYSVYYCVCVYVLCCIQVTIRGSLFKHQTTENGNENTWPQSGNMIASPVSEYE